MFRAIKDKLTKRGHSNADERAAKMAFDKFKRDVERGFLADYREIYDDPGGDEWIDYNLLGRHKDKAVRGIHQARDMKGFIKAMNEFAWDFAAMYEKEFGRSEGGNEWVDFLGKTHSVAHDYIESIGEDPIYYDWLD